MSTAEPDAIIADYDCNVTIMNNSSYTLINMQDEIQFGSGFSPIPPTTIGSKNTPSPSYEASFTLNQSLFSGAVGSVSFEFEAASGAITFNFSCPQLGSNSAIATWTNSEIFCEWYGSTTAIQWSQDGSNWGPQNEIPENGHPLFVLFVLTSPTGKE